jgi:hypothetical protein
LTVTFSPVGVDTAKLDADTPVTLPTEPPAAFVDRALDPPPDPAWRANPVELLLCVAVVDGAVAAAELEVPPHAASPSPSAGTNSATAIPRTRFLKGPRRRLVRLGWSGDIALDSRRIVSLLPFISAALQSVRWTI